MRGERRAESGNYNLEIFVKDGKIQFFKLDLIDG